MLQQVNRFFLIFSTIFVTNSVKAQTITHNSFTFNEFRPYKPNCFSIRNSENSVKLVVPGNFYTKNLSFFCRQEIRFEAKTRFPLKFRLGTLAYCDWLEGKRYGWNPVTGSFHSR